LVCYCVLTKMVSIALHTLLELQESVCWWRKRWLQNKQ